MATGLKPKLDKPAPRPRGRPQSDPRLNEVIVCAADGSLAEHDHRYALAAISGAFNSIHRTVRSGSGSPRKIGQGILDVVLAGMIPRG